MIGIYGLVNKPLTEETFGRLNYMLADQATDLLHACYRLSLFLPYLPSSSGDL